jgi:hypothetical protein
MMYAVDMGSGAVIYKSNFTKISLGIQKLMEWGRFTHIQTQRQHGDLISLHLFFQNKESGFKTGRRDG